MDVNVIIEKIFRIFGYWLLVGGAFLMARAWIEVTRKNKEIPAEFSEKFWEYVRVAIVLAVISWGIGWGNPNGNRENAIVFFVVAIVCGYLGLRSGYSKDAKLTPSERAEIKRKIERPDHPDYG